MERLHDTVAEHDLGDSVSFLGFVSGTEKQRVLREAWAFALPQSKTTSSADSPDSSRDRLVGIRASQQEHFGVAVLEAVAAGLSVVISGAVQLRAFVEDHDLGVIVDRSDPFAIPAGLEAVLADEAGRRRVAAAGPAAVQATFSVGRVGEQLGALYQQAVGAHR